MLASFAMFAVTAADLPGKPSLGSYIAWTVVLWVVAMQIVVGHGWLELSNRNRQEFIKENRRTPDNEQPVPTLWQALRRTTITFGVVVVIAAASTFLIVLGYDNDHQNYQAQARIESAASARTPPEALEVLAQDERSDVRLVAAANPRTPPDALAALALDSVILVRSSVGANHNSSPETLEMLAGDSDAAVRVAVIRNPSTPDHARVLASG